MALNPSLAASHIREALLALGFPVNGEAMKDTPLRVARAWMEMTSGLAEDPERHLKVTFDGEDYQEAVALAGIPFVSLCEHHLLPFHGTAGVAYIPQGRVVGLSKLARTVDVFARRPQLQERLTKQIADAIDHHLRPLGAAVVIEAQHACMTCRGAMKAGAVMRTSALRGTLHKDGDARTEVLRLLRV